MQQFTVTSAYNKSMRRKQTHFTCALIMQLNQLWNLAREDILCIRYIHYPSQSLVPHNCRTPPHTHRGNLPWAYKTILNPNPPSGFQEYIYIYIYMPYKNPRKQHETRKLVWFSLPFIFSVIKIVIENETIP